MNKVLSVLISMVILIAAVASAETLNQLDELHELDRHEQIVALIDGRLGGSLSDTNKAELLWRKARAQVTIVDYGRWKSVMTDAEAIELLQQAEATADEAIALSPNAAEPRFWKAAAMGLRGQIRGILNSLFMASDVRDYAVEAIDRNDRYTEAYYLLGKLYRELPGRPFSFGNRDAAVSLARKAVKLHETELESGTVGIRYYDSYTQLAEALWRRNYNADRRRRRHSQAAERYRSATTALERGSAFEGSLTLAAGSDREEAIQLVEMVTGELSRLGSANDRERKDLDSAEKLLSKWR